MARQPVHEIQRELLKVRIGCRRTGSTNRKTIPILVTQILIVGVVVVVLLTVAMSVTRAFDQLREGIRKARENEKIDNSHLWTGNGGVRHEDSDREKSQPRIGELRKHYDFWRRWDEPR